MYVVRILQIFLLNKYITTYTHGSILNIRNEYYLVPCAAISNVYDVKSYVMYPDSSHREP